MMLVVLFSNYLNHHQVLIADSLYKRLGNNFFFVATLPRNEKELKGSIDYSSRPYCILAGESDNAKNTAMRLSIESDVCIFGACSQIYAVNRAKHCPQKLSFECGERWLKKGMLNICSPVLLRWWFNYICYYRRAKFYKLCSSAFASLDDKKMGCYAGKHYKWGYFTDVPSYQQYMDFTHQKETCLKKTINLMWCARFIHWKHPELPIECARLLKRNGYHFILNMYGNGNLQDKMRRLVRKYQLDDVVLFHGNLPNKQILEAMRRNDVFLFTSDRQEGWGAVANEAMANGCCLVCSDEVGAGPYLINNFEDGILFKSKSIRDLYKNIKFLLDNPIRCKSLSQKGYEKMYNIWNPDRAVDSLLLLINDLMTGREQSSIVEGPCSVA